MGEEQAEVEGREGKKEGRKRRKEERKSDKRWKGRETLPYGWGGGRREEMYLIEEQRVFSRVGGRVEGVQWLSPAILLTYLL